MPNEIEDLKVKRAMAALDKLAAAWAAENDLTRHVSTMLLQPDKESRLESYIKMAFGEGAYAGWMSLNDALEAEILRLRSMIAGHANGYVPATLAIQREAGAIRASGNDGRGYVYGTEGEVEAA